MTHSGPARNDDSAPENSVLAQLRSLARQAAVRSWTPYSGREEGVVLLLSDGAYIPGVRIENASFPLTIPAIVSAVTTASTLGRNDIVAIVSSVTMAPEDVVYADELPESNLRYHDEHTMLGADVAPLPVPDEALDPTIHWTATEPLAAIHVARDVARRANPRESNFPVGAVLELQPGRGIPGTNVEHPDWSRILCAERNALSTARSYGFDLGDALFLSCPKDSEASPCGACRQVIVELAPGAQVWMDRGNEAPQRQAAGDLLPGYFSGSALLTPPS